MKTLCLAGWAQPHDALAVIAPDAHHLNYYPHTKPESVLELIAEHHDIERAIGWSLGGWLLMHAVQAGLLEPQQLVLIAPPLQYVKSDDFAHGMDQTTFDLFYSSYTSDPSRTAARFSGLMAKGDRDAKRLMQELEHAEHTTDAETWGPWLKVLEAQHHEDINFTNFPPTLIIHGEADQIIPLGQGKALAEKIGHAQLHLMADCAHVPHLHNKDAVQTAIAEHAKTARIAA